MKQLLSLISLLTFGFILVLPIKSVSAQSTTASLYFVPGSKSVAVNESFPVDIYVKSTGPKRISYIRAIVTFDPTLLEITSVQHSQLLCNFPTDESNYEVNNTDGTFMVTGTSTGTQQCPFPELTEQGTIFARITLKVKKAGTANLEFLYNGQAGDTVSGIMDTNSPTQYIMTAPTKGTYTLGSTVTATPKPPGNLGVDPRIVIGFSLIIAAIGWMLRPHKQAPRVMTVTE